MRQKAASRLEWGTAVFRKREKYAGNRSEYALVDSRYYYGYGKQRNTPGKSGIGK